MPPPERARTWPTRTSAAPRTWPMPRTTAAAPQTWSPTGRRPQHRRPYPPGRARTSRTNPASMRRARKIRPRRPPGHRPGRLRPDWTAPHPTGRNVGRKGSPPTGSTDRQREHHLRRRYRQRRYRQKNHRRKRRRRRTHRRRASSPCRRPAPRPRRRRQDGGNDRRPALRPTRRPGRNRGGPPTGRAGHPDCRSRTTPGSLPGGVRGPCAHRIPASPSPRRRGTTSTIAIAPGLDRYRPRAQLSSAPGSMGVSASSTSALRATPTTCTPVSRSMRRTPIVWRWARRTSLAMVRSTPPLEAIA